MKNSDRNGGRHLDVITLTCEKSRYGLSGSITYHYAEGKMLPFEDRAPDTTVSTKLLELLKGNPGILTGAFTKLGEEHGLGRNQARKFLKDGVKSGAIRVENDGRRRPHLLSSADGKSDG